MNILFSKLGQKILRFTGNGGYSKELIMKVFQLPNGNNETFFIDLGKDSVQIICITKSEIGTAPQVVLVEQFRAGTETIEIELPGGGLDSSENPLAGGVRELREETGYVGDATYLGKAPYSPYSTGFRHMVLVINGVRTEEKSLDPNEYLNVKTIPLRDFREKIKTAKIRGWELGYMALDYIGHL